MIALLSTQAPARQPVAGAATTPVPPSPVTSAVDHPSDKDAWTPSPALSSPVQSPWLGAGTTPARGGAVPAAELTAGAQAAAESPSLSAPLRVGAALLAALSLAGTAAQAGTAIAAPVAGAATISQQALSDSFPETRQALENMQFPAIDPYKASVAATVWSSAHQAESGPVVEVPAPRHFGRTVPVELQLGNGSGAPLLVILPGLGADADASHVGALKKMALDRGMNYAVVPNPFSLAWQNAGPKTVPGVLPEEAAAVQEILQGVRAEHPEAFKNVSLAGYSYGGILGATLLSGQDSAAPIVNGAMVAVSPAVDLVHSMNRLDDLRHDYATALDWSDVGLKYAKEVANYGFERITESPLVRRAENDAEKFLADSIGARLPLRAVVNSVDRSSGRNLLPLNKALATGETLDADRKDELADEQEWALDDASFAGYTRDYLMRDPWFGAHGTTPQALSEQYSYPRLLEAIHGVLVMTVASADDYILTRDDVARLQTLASAPATGQVTKVFEHGGHVGLLFQPQLRETMMNFVRPAPRPAPVAR